jgi:hypothetical protein
MAESYSFQVESFENGTWTVTASARDRRVADRESPDIARAVLEDWIIDNPDQLAGGGRVSVYGGDPLEYPPDGVARVRVVIFRDSPDGEKPEPDAAAFLLADPDIEDL